MSTDESVLFKRKYYRVLIPVAVLAVLLGWTLEWFISGRPGQFDTVTLLGAAALFAVLGVALWQRFVSEQTGDILFAGGVGAFMLVRLGYAVYFLEPGKSMGTELTEFAFWMPTYVGLLFLVFGLDRGLLASSAFVAATVLLPVPAVGSGGLAPQELYSLSMLGMSLGVTVFVFRMLGKALLRSGTERRTFRQMAVTDSLTGIANRRGLQDTLTEEHARMKRYGGHFSVLILDLDRFKEINDRHGHDAGDKVLIEISKLLESESREVDTVGRWGGEEFMAILPHVGVSKATEVASRIRSKVENHAFHDAIDVTLSIGVAECAAGETVEQLVSRADQALYKAKQGGRNRVAEAP